MKKILKPTFLKWLRKQFATREFNYANTGHCLFASFLKETTFPNLKKCGCSLFLLENGEAVAFPDWMVRLDGRVRDLEISFTVADVRKLLKT